MEAVFARSGLPERGTLVLRRPSLPATFPRLHRRHDSILLDHHALRHKLKKPLAFFASVGLSDCSRYLIGFFVFKLNDKFPLGTESILGHACILYEFVP